MKLLLLVALCWGAFEARAELNIYSDRAQELLQPIVDDFESKTGVEVEIVGLSSKDLLARLEAEGENTFADLIIVKDMVYLNELTDEGYFQAHKSKSPEAYVASAMRHPENLWSAITFRARTIVYNNKNNIAADVQNYVELADERFKGKLCVRTSNSSYNVALVSGFIHSMGYEAALEMVSSWVSNLNSEAPTSNDRAALDLVAQGVCDAGVVNSYYLAQKLSADPAYPVGITFADQGKGGVLTNGVGIGVSAYSEKVDLASQFIDLILEDKAQLHLSNSHGDYPAKMGLMPDTLVRDWGVFQTDAVNWSVLGLQHESAKQLFLDAKYL